MPIKWSPENDQTLLLKIMETSNVQVDAKAISDAWPPEKGDAQGKGPTPRAITERLVKIRQQAKQNGSGHFAVGSAQTKSPSTPRKTKTPKDPKTPKTKTPSKLSTATPALSQDSMTIGTPASTNATSPVSSQESEVATPASSMVSAGKRKRADTVRIKDEGDDELEGAMDGFSVETPSKKAKTNVVDHLSNVEYSFDLGYDDGAY